jgi:ribonuclease R
MPSKRAPSAAPPDDTLDDAPATARRRSSSIDERILDELGAAGTPLPPDELAARLRVGRRQRDAYDGAVAELERAGRILVNRKGELCIVQKLDLVTGTLQGHPDGFGFLVPDAGGDDLFLNPREMHKAMHGDRAAARIVGIDRRGRPEGEIVEVLTRVNREIVGRLHEDRGIWFVEAENRRINQDILIPPDERHGAQPGQVVVVEILEQPSATRASVATRCIFRAA